jgi:pimeloyl-ACP methyl ester carboxylesterase
MTTTALDTRTITLDGGLTVAYRELGSGSPILLLHGWPTSSSLWRHVMPRLAEQNRVVALDLPGFGASDKPAGVRYDFALFEQAIDGVVERLGLDRLGIVGHDLGGPVAVHWALREPSRVTAIALLNTLLYPEISDAVVEFVATLSSPARRGELVSDEGLAGIMRLGVSDPAVVTEELLAIVRGPFPTDAHRIALANAGVGLSLPGLAEIAAGLPTLTMPVRAIYGEQDRILLDVADTMARLAGDVPHAEVTALPDVGHFLQEEDPERVADLLARFFAPPA